MFMFNCRNNYTVVGNLVVFVIQLNNRGKYDLSANKYNQTTFRRLFKLLDPGALSTLLRVCSIRNVILA